MNGLPVDVGDEVAGTQAGLLGGAAILNVLRGIKDGNALR